MMELAIVLSGFGVLLLAIIILSVLVLRSRIARIEAAPADDMLSLKGQLEQITLQAGSQASAQAEQMAALSKRLEESLATMNERMGRQLNLHSEKTHENLNKLAERLAVIDAANTQIEQLTGQVVQLHNILANKTDRGAFGEVQLENLVRNVLPPDAYEFQVQLSNGRRADCLLKLPNPPGDIVIDAKFPLEAWHRMQQAGSEADRLAERKQLGTDILKHVKDIHEKYIIAGETSDSACLFLPSEAIYAELHAHMRDIVDKSYAARVWIVSPTTMMATLNTVRAVLRDARMREQTALIQKEIGLLTDDVVRLGRRVENLDRHFGQAVKDIDDIKISTSKINSRGKRIQNYDFEDKQAELADDSDMIMPPQISDDTAPDD
jgi:DNA recombination protein RmuC